MLPYTCTCVIDLFVIPSLTGYFRDSKLAGLQQSSSIVHIRNTWGRVCSSVWVYSSFYHTAHYSGIRYWVRVAQNNTNDYFIFVVHFSARFIKKLAHHSALKGITTLSIFFYKYIADTSFVFLSCVKTHHGFVSYSSMVLLIFIRFLFPIRSGVSV